MPEEEMDWDEFFLAPAGNVPTADRRRRSHSKPGRPVTPAFWDTSALVPLCVQQRPSPAARLLVQQYSIAVWWATPVEMRSAFERLLRMGHLTYPEHATAGQRLERLRRSWRELQPSEALRAHAEGFLTRLTPSKRRTPCNSLPHGPGVRVIPEQAYSSPGMRSFLVLRRGSDSESWLPDS